ncbi:putative SOS response-associated peptidase YedK [Roseinatronobacter bogoriensis subsp. barguzinensis]|nr:putative SOS response-associated peptidase YedK [Rhodobaca barguzinensis]TDY67052.1 putative SOS response-associated peptidase YedK [Rhodobaca bogoriensis DSM 18756]
MARAFQAQPANDLPPVPRFNICPTQPVATVVSRDGARHLGPMRWGFLPHWYKTETDGPLLINARAETIANKPAFADAARTRRCLIPATGFYEWTKGADGARLPWYIRPAQGDLLAFAGIWQVWEQGDRRLVTCAIVTCAANSQMAKLHHRMPVILSQADWPLWLGEAGHGAATLMRAAPDDTLEAHRVSPAVNSNRAEGAELIEPLDAER